VSLSAKLVTTYWTVGFSGRRELAEPGKIAAVISCELAVLKGKIKGELAAVSSIAIGADTLFAEEVLKLGVPWIALLPFPREEFAKDFAAADWARAEQCLSRALAEEVWSPVADRPNAYHDVGINTVDECDVLLAVWDGGPADGSGGTADMARYARRKKKPLVWIHSETGAVTRERCEEAHFRDPLFESLLALPEPESGGHARAPLEAFLRKTDEAAKKHLPKVRSIETRIVLLNSIAAFIAAFATAMQYNALDFVTLALLPMIYALYLMSRLHFPKRRQKFVQARLAAELCRSLQATRDFPGRLTDLYRSAVPEFEHMMRSLLITRDIEKKGIHAMGSAGAAGSFQERYLADRIRFQHAYYRKHRIEALPRAKRYTWVTVAASSAAVLATVVLAGIGLSVTRFDPFPASYQFITHYISNKAGTIPTNAPDSKPLALLGIAAPLIASVFTALLAVNEYKRRSARYREMEQLLTAADVRLTHARTPRAIKQVIVDTESALLGENYQWYYQAGM
jgi:hypothetical protein